jgi:hypothetical protein
LARERAIADQAAVLFEWVLEIPRRRAYWLAVQLAAGRDSGVDAFFIDTLGWTRTPSRDERQAAFVILVRGKRWRRPDKVEAAKITAYLSRAISKQVWRDRRTRDVITVKDSQGRRGGRAADGALLQRRITVLLRTHGLTEQQQALLERLAVGDGPAEALRATGGALASLPITDEASTSPRATSAESLTP